MMVRKNKTNKAFTLIEVLVVTAVVSLVASIVNAQMSEARQKADDSHMKTEVQQVRTAVEQYRQKTGSVPTVSPSGSYVAGSMVTEDSTEYQEVMQQLVDEGYMPEVPSSPDGQSYSYLATTDGEEAVFAATLNNEDSDSNTNSCEVVESITVTSCSYGYAYCDEVTYDSSSQLLYCEKYYNGDEGNLSEACDYSNRLDNNCNGEVLIDELPQDACDLPYGDNSFGEGCSRAAAPYYMLCDYTGEKAVCDGFNDSDYCSCI